MTISLTDGAATNCVAEEGQIAVVGPEILISPITVVDSIKTQATVDADEVDTGNAENG